MKRIQRKRTKGWRMPENTVYIGRGSKCGNPEWGAPDGNVFIIKLGRRIELWDVIAAIDGMLKKTYVRHL
jgi:hypothetical protein